MNRQSYEYSSRGGTVVAFRLLLWATRKSNKVNHEPAIHAFPRTI